MIKSTGINHIYLYEGVVAHSVASQHPDRAVWLVLNNETHVWQSYCKSNVLFAVQGVSFLYVRRIIKPHKFVRK